MDTIHRQFQYNLGILSEKEFVEIQQSHILIVGLGGLGGHFANNIVRLGVKQITLIDFDCFDISNLNRQLFSSHENISKYKVDILHNELLKINPNCTIKTIINKVEDVDKDAFSDIDYIIDTVDSPQTKVYLATLSTTLDIPLLHGACAGWYGQVGWILPGCNLLEETYDGVNPGLERELHNPSFTPNAIASYMTSEFVKYIQESDETIINQLLLIDLFNNTTMKTGTKNG